MAFLTLLQCFVLFLLLHWGYATLEDKSLENICLSHLHEFLPPMDRGILAERQLRQNVKLALQARATHSWAYNVPFNIFLDYVLPHASLDEPRDQWRSLFFETFSPLVANATSLSEAFSILNKNIWSIFGIVFKAQQTPDIMSPTQVIRRGYASCTGFSIFLVDAARAVGIPARVVGVPSWDETQFANHNWVETWDTYWSFTDAGPTCSLNKTWFFPNPIKKLKQDSWMHAVWAASYRPTQDGFFPLVWHLEYEHVPGYNVTGYYLSAPLTIV